MGETESSGAFNETWKNLYRQFPVNRESIWLNNCGAVPSSRVVEEGMKRYLAGYSKMGFLTDVRSFENTSRRIKEILSALLKCDPEELALIHNTAEGMNLVSWGLDLEPGDEILLLENEYPSNVYPWEHWREKGVTLKFVDPGLNQAGFFENFRNSLTEKTRLCAFSSAFWCTGMPLPVEAIDEECKKRNIMLVIDGAQGVGHIPIDLSRLNIMSMAFPAWKWLAGPLGLGVLYVNKSRINQIRYIFKGQGSVVNAETYLPYKDEIKQGAARYEYSTPSFTDWVYFETALELFHQTGFEKIMARIFYLGKYLEEKLSLAGFQVLSAGFPENPTGIIVFEKPGIPSTRLFKRLEKNRIYGALRLERIRLSVHAYNSEKQLDRVVDVLHF